MNVGIFSMAEYNGMMGRDYFPSWMEIALTMAMVAFRKILERSETGALSMYRQYSRKFYSKRRSIWQKG
jgi:hypothetical protein